MNSFNIVIPRLMGWLLRVFDIPDAQRAIGRDPVLFAQWYAMSRELLSWPEEAESIAQAERKKTIEIDRLAKVMQTLGFSSLRGMGADQTRLLMEGYVVHDWVNSNWKMFEELLEEAKDKYTGDGFVHAPPVGEYASRVDELAKVLDLTLAQVEILEFAFTCAVGGEFFGLMSALAQRFKGRTSIWESIFGYSSSELAEALSREGNLFRSGVLEPADAVGLVRVHSYWIESFVEAKGTLQEQLLAPLKEERNAGVMAVIDEADMKLAVNVLKGKKASQTGVNLLLYGASSLDKRRILLDMVNKSQFEAWHLKFDDIPRGARRTAAYVALRLLDKTPDRVLVVEKPGDILEETGNQLFKMLFGIEIEPRSSKDDEIFLTSFTTPAIWLLSDTHALASDTIARFVFHAPLKKADRHQRKNQMERLLTSSNLGKDVREKIVRLDGVSALQIDSALQAAALSGAMRGKARDHAVFQAIQRSQKALGRDLTEKFKTSVTQYSMELLNCSGRFGPTQIMEALQRTRQGTLVFYGPPGTGKTQFVEHMAAQLGIPLIAKHASDLMSKYVGDNEKNIADMFEEAVNEDAMLLLDEGDSFLRDRSFARAQWEVSMVNELLQRMERFPGIFVVCTNLFSGLDAAALRRFTFKLEFGELTPEQRWNMFVTEANLGDALNTLPPGTKEDWWERLAMMDLLTAGDFATVQRQCKILQISLTPTEWLTQLAQEVKVKKKEKARPEME